MCGRFSVSLPPDEVARYFQARGRLPNFPPRHNMAPTQDAPVKRLAPQIHRAAEDARYWATLWRLVKEGPPAGTELRMNLGASRMRP